MSLVGLALGSGAGAAVHALTAEEAPPALHGRLTELGPVSIVLPADHAPWETVAEGGAAATAASPDTEVEGVWGALAPGSVVVTVLRLAGPGGADLAVASVPDDEPAPWAGRVPHASGAAEADGQREMVLVVETDDGDLVVLSVCGPVEAFDSGSLAEAFRTARVE